MKIYNPYEKEPIDSYSYLDNEIEGKFNHDDYIDIDEETAYKDDLYSFAEVYIGGYWGQEYFDRLLSSSRGIKAKDIFDVIKDNNYDIDDFDVFWTQTADFLQLYCNSSDYFVGTRIYEEFFSYAPHYAVELAFRDEVRFRKIFESGPAAVNEPYIELVKDTLLVLEKRNDMDNARRLLKLFISKSNDSEVEKLCWLCKEYKGNREWLLEAIKVIDISLANYVGKDYVFTSSIAQINDSSFDKEIQLARASIINNGYKLLGEEFAE